MFKYCAATVLLIVALAGVANAEGESFSMNTITVEELTKIEDGVISEDLAKKIVAYREKNGPFTTTKDLLNVPGLQSLLLDMLLLQEKNGDVIYEPDVYVTLPTY